MDTTESSPSGHLTTTDPATIAGDTFAYAGDKGSSCFACYEGVVYLGELVMDEDLVEVEVVEPVRCRRCSDNRA